MGNSPPARFNGLPKIHKADVPLRPIISACGTSTYKLSKFLTTILQKYTGKNFSFVKDSKGLAKSLKGKTINSDETIFSVDVSALFTSIPVPVALAAINRKITTHISQEGLQPFLAHSHSIPKDKINALLEIVLNNCVFSFQHKFYKQLQGAVMGSPVSPVIENIYMEYFKQLALGPKCPIPTPWWKRYVDDVICITKKDQMDILINHINFMGDHIKFTMECPGNEGSIPFVDTECTQNPNHTIHITVCRKPTHTDRYLD